MSAAAHAARMDAIYAGQRHIYDATRKYYLLGRDRLIADLAPPPGGRVVEVGCGTGRNLILAARRWPRARCFGFDISDAMLATARAKAGDHILLARGDATAWDPLSLFGIDAADEVFMSYTLSMIPDWARAIEVACDALAPGGRLHIVDFGQQERLPVAFRRAFFAWLARFEVTPRRDLPRFLAAMAAAQGLTHTFSSLYRGYAWRAVLERPA